MCVNDPGLTASGCSHVTVCPAPCGVTAQNQSKLREWQGVVGSGFVKATMAGLETVPPWLEMTVKQVNLVTRRQFVDAYVGKSSVAVFLEAVLQSLERYFKAGVVALRVTGCACGVACSVPFWERCSCGFDTRVTVYFACSLDNGAEGVADAHSGNHDRSSGVGLALGWVLSEASRLLCVQADSG